MTPSLQSLHVQGEQEREVVRVIVDCCMNEREYNPYYSFLVVKLCQASKVRACLCLCVRACVHANALRPDGGSFPGAGLHFPRSLTPCRMEPPRHTTRYHLHLGGMVANGANKAQGSLPQPQNPITITGPLGPSISVHARACAHTHALTLSLSHTHTRPSHAPPAVAPAHHPVLHVGPVQGAGRAGGATEGQPGAPQRLPHRALPAAHLEPQGAIGLLEAYQVSEPLWTPPTKEGRPAVRLACISTMIDEDLMMVDGNIHFNNGR